MPDVLALCKRKLERYMYLFKVTVAGARLKSETATNLAVPISLVYRPCCFSETLSYRCSFFRFLGQDLPLRGPSLLGSGVDRNLNGRDHKYGIEFDQRMSRGVMLQAQSTALRSRLSILQRPCIKGEQGLFPGMWARYNTQRCAWILWSGYSVRHQE